MADKRFDALVKRQEGEHQHALSCHNKEMQALRDSLNLAIERFDSLSNRNDQELKDFKTYSVCQMGILKVKLESNELFIASQQKTIEDLHKQLNELSESHASNIDIKNMRNDLGLEIKANTTSHINAFQEFQREFKTLILSIKNDLFKVKYEVDQKLAELTEKVESNFVISRLDKDGVLKQVRVYEKSMFVIEKKIENIYTLIERINNRGEVCRKPEL